MSNNVAELELTRGNVKTAMKDAGATSADLWRVRPEQLRVIPGFNGRVRNAAYDAHIETIVSSIVENGYYQDKPLAGYVAIDEDGNNVIYITEGHTRNEAIPIAIERGAKIETVPVVIKPNGTTVEDLTFALVTSNNGKPFTPYETALIVKRLVDMGTDEKVIAKRLGYTKNYVDGLLTLAGASKAVRDMVQDEKVAATLAIDMVKKHGPKAAEHLREGMVQAKAAGKTKVTAKHVKAAAEKTEPKVKLIAQVGTVAEPMTDADGNELVELTILIPATSAIAEGDSFVIGKITKAKVEESTSAETEEGEL